MRCGPPHAAARPAEVAYRSLGCEVQCGTCICYAEEIVAEERADLLSVDARAA